MKQPSWILTFAFVLGSFGVAAGAQDSRPFNDRPNNVRIRYGLFEPSGDSVYWQTREEDFFGDASDLEDGRWGLDYMRMFTERWAVLASTSFYDDGVTTSYRDFVDNQGNEIVHDLTLDLSNLEFGVVYFPLRRSFVVAPYLGAGLDWTFYELRESGDFIEPRSNRVISGTFSDDGSELGWFWLVGLEVPIGQQFGLFAEARWHDVDAQLGGDFEDFGTIDLGGRELSVGASFRF